VFISGSLASCRIDSETSQKCQRNQNFHQSQSFAERGISFDRDFYRELSEQNPYKNAQNPNSKIIKNDLLIIQKNRGFQKLGKILNNSLSFLFGFITRIAILITKTSPVKDILEITNFLSKSRDY